MTLGDFRRITEQYDDECELFWCRDLTSLMGAVKVRRVIIDVCDTGSDDPSNQTPAIIVL